MQERDVTNVQKNAVHGGPPASGLFFQEQPCDKKKTNLLIFLTPILSRNRRPSTL